MGQRRSHPRVVAAGRSPTAPARAPKRQEHVVFLAITAVDSAQSLAAANLASLTQPAARLPTSPTTACSVPASHPCFQHALGLPQVTVTATGNFTAARPERVTVPFTVFAMIARPLQSQARSRPCAISFRPRPRASLALARSPFDCPRPHPRARHRHASIAIL